jgi:hypothetical protein
VIKDEGVVEEEGVEEGEEGERTGDAIFLCEVKLTVWVKLSPAKNMGKNNMCIKICSWKMDIEMNRDIYPCRIKNINKTKKNTIKKKKKKKRKRKNIFS